jgi:hypothetical protein
MQSSPETTPKFDRKTLEYWAWAPRKIIRLWETSAEPLETRDPVFKIYYYKALVSLTKKDDPNYDYYDTLSRNSLIINRFNQDHELATVQSYESTGKRPVGHLRETHIMQFYTGRDAFTSLDYRIRQLKRAAEQGNMNALVALVEVYLDANERERALSCLNNAIKMGSSQAMFLMGIYELKKNNKPLAIEWWEKAYLDGHEYATLCLVATYQETSPRKAVIYARDLPPGIREKRLDALDPAMQE